MSASGGVEASLHVGVVSDPSACHPVEYLFARMAMVAPYPPGVVPVPGRIAGRAGFPGGSGLWGTRAGQPLPPAPVGQAMVLGHNFDTLAGFQRSLERGAENFRIPTWRHLMALFEAVGLPPERCFFTNAYMGLIDGTSNVGRFPGARNPAFVARCTAFLAEQLAVLQPRAVLTLGGAVLPLVASLAGPIAEAWRTATSAAQLDERGVALLFPVQFAGVPHPTALAALTHPAQRPLNVGRRHYQGLTGDAAEQALLRDALQHLSGGLALEPDEP